MRINSGGRLRRIALVLSLGVLAALAIAGATSARVDYGPPDSASPMSLEGQSESVTFCHVAGSAEDPANIVTLTLPYTAVFGQAGHFNEDGTPKAGHEQDYLGPCQTTPPPTDVCPNIGGNQATVPEGMVKDEQGNCVTPPPPPTDVCPNIDGNQATVPEGMVKDEQGNCVTPPPPPPTTQTTPPTDEFMDVQVIKDATPQVQLVNGQADIAYTIRVRNNGPNQAHNVVVSDAAPSGVTFVAVTLVGGNCTVTAALLNCTLGTLGPGVERTIELSARVTQTGTYVNSATGAGDGKDTNGANNTDDASTLVTAPLTPPTTTPKPPVTPKPTAKPKPKPSRLNICRVLKVTPGLVKANGKNQLVLAKVTRSKTPVARRRGAVHRDRPRQGREDERAGRCPDQRQAGQGGDHAREDHEREGVQQRPHRRGRRLRAAGHGLEDSPSRHSVGVPGLVPGTLMPRGRVGGAARPRQPHVSSRMKLTGPIGTSASTSVDTKTAQSMYDSSGRGGGADQRKE